MRRGFKEPHPKKSIPAHKSARQRVWQIVVMVLVVILLMLLLVARMSHKGHLLR